MRAISIVLLVLANLRCALTNTTKEMEYKEGQSVEAAYLLPPINVSVGDNGTLVTASLARVLNFYNTELLAAGWGRIGALVSPACQRDIGLYIKGLRNTDNWALKMDDASGRYSTGWFWGNHYWTGSQSLCENIGPKNEKHLINFKNRTAPAVPSNTSQTQGYKLLSASSVPPFPVAFFMTRVHLNSSFTTEDRILHVGFCMPHICTDADVKAIVEETSRASRLITVNVEAVRSPHNKFEIFKDRTFLFLCGITCAVTLCLIIGTSYDFYLEYVQNKKAKTILNHSHLKLDMTMPNTKTKNGNCGLYVVNNGNSDANPNIESTLEIRKVNKFSIIKMVIREVVLAFSLRINIRTICDQTVSSDTLPVIHGLKSFSMAWVILGHTCIVAFKYSDNMEYRKVVQRDFFFQTISNGAFSVDTFFFTSGLLVSFLYFRSNAKGNLATITNSEHGFLSALAHFFGLLFYRFVRLTAPYVFTIGVVEVTMKWFNYNSVFEPPTMDHVNCPNYWWRNILYINTLFPVEEMCMLWSWYLSDDTQFYVVGAVILILATRHFKSAAAILIIFMISSWITTGYIAYSNSHMPGSDDPLALFDKIYDKPWTRLGPYLIGMCVGWFLFKKNCQLHMGRMTVIAGWTAAIACLLALVYGLYDANLSPAAGAAYSALSHSAWAVGLGWIVVACSTGHGGLANTILSNTVLYPFSRVTYCAYLFHPIVIRVMAMSMDSPLHLGGVVMIIIFFGQVIAAYAVSFFVSLAFEAPIVCMLRIIAKIGIPQKSNTH